MKKLVLLLALSLGFLSCDVAKQTLGSAYSLTQCEYDYQSITGLTLAGVSLQNGSSFNPLAAAGLLTALNSSSLPLQFTLQLGVKNPGKSEAALSGLQYILEIDGIAMTEGFLNQALRVPSGSSTVMPLQMSFDLKKAMSGQSAEAVKNMAYNLAGIGQSASQVTFRIKPSMLLGGQNVVSPVYIPITFSFGGK